MDNFRHVCSEAVTNYLPCRRGVSASRESFWILCVGAAVALWVTVEGESEILGLPVVVGLPCSALAFDLVGYFVDLIKDVAVAVYKVGDL